MKSVPYTLTELIRLDTFVDWVLQPKASLDSYWQQYLERFPSQGTLLVSAREYVLLLAVDTGRHQPSADQSQKMWEAVKSKMKKD